MGGGGPQAPMTLEQKKKLLWGKKPDPEEPAPSTAFGANRWDTAEFSNAGDKSKFIKLMVMPSACAIHPADVQTASPGRVCLISCLYAHGVSAHDSTWAGSKPVLLADLACHCGL